MRRVGLGLTLGFALALALAVAPPNTPTRASTASGDPVIAAAGDIACARPQPNVLKHTCYESPTSALILNHPEVAKVQTLGDNQYPCGSYGQFLRGYDPSWGQFLASTQPVIGNHEYETNRAACDNQASGYFQYFGAAAQPNGADGYYYYDIAGTGTSTAHWRVIVLNANCAIVSCAHGSAQEQFLQSAITTAPPGTRIMAAWHQPYYSGSGLGPATDAVKPFWDDLYAAQAALVLNGHAHYYERYAPQSPNGVADPAGITEIIAGAGGASLGHANVISPNTQAYWNDQYGVLLVTLHDSSFDWQFIQADGSPSGFVRDSGTQLLPPLVSGLSPTSGSVGTVVTITGSGFSDTTAVTFNGTAAVSPTVNSDTQITATVPSLATTGPVCVTARGTTGCSASPFTVT